jgi:hypothetical protein
MFAIQFVCAKNEHQYKIFIVQSADYKHFVFWHADGMVKTIGLC